MERGLLKSDILLLITATIWGFAFVAQRVGMEYVGPFTFNGVRFALGCMVLLPLVWRAKLESRRTSGRTAELLWGGGLAGLFLFGGASFQQIGLVYTTAGNAGFITGLYVVVVPVLGLLVRQRATTGTWLGAVLAAGGLYLLSIKGDFSIGFGDLLELIGAFLWAGHVLIIGWLTSKLPAVKLAFIQFAVCSLFSHWLWGASLRRGRLYPASGCPAGGPSRPCLDYPKPGGRGGGSRRLAHAERNPFPARNGRLRPHAVRHVVVAAVGPVVAPVKMISEAGHCQGSICFLNAPEKIS